jgi:hypothetical protein
VRCSRAGNFASASSHACSVLRNGPNFGRGWRAGHLSNRLLNQDAIVLDELDYLPFSADGRALLFHLISKLYERVSLIVTTNLSFCPSANGAPFLAMLR